MKPIDAIVIIIFAGLGIHAWSSPPRSTPRDFVTKIIDGDTVEVNYGERIRLAGVQTPERGEDKYYKASFELARLTLRRHVNVKRFPQKTWGRTIAVIYVDGRQVNASMRKKYKDKKYDRLLTKEQLAELKKGGWK